MNEHRDGEKPWSEDDLFDLESALAWGGNIKDIADFLSREVGEVRQKASERNLLGTQEKRPPAPSVRPRMPQPSDDVTIYLVLNDSAKHGIAYDETDRAKGDRETIIRNFRTGRYGNALRVVAFNTAEGWSWDVSEDIALEVLQLVIDADDNLNEGTKRFIDRHVVDPANPAPRAQTSPVDLIDTDVEKRPAAPSVRRLPEGYVRHRANTRNE